MRVIVQELCESRGGRPGLSVLTSLLVSVDSCIESCSRSGLIVSLIYQPTSEDTKHHLKEGDTRHMPMGGLKTMCGSSIDPFTAVMSLENDQ